MNLAFLVATEHVSPIIDFGFTGTTIYTTSQDSSLRGSDIETGEQILMVAEDLECDHLEA
jgi:hypothetical protein